MSQEKSDVLYLGLQAGEQPLGLQISSTNLCRLTSVCRKGTPLSFVWRVTEWEGRAQRRAGLCPISVEMETVGHMACMVGWQWLWLSAG